MLTSTLSFSFSKLTADSWSWAVFNYSVFILRLASDYLRQSYISDCSFCRFLDASLLLVASLFALLIRSSFFLSSDSSWVMTDAFYSQSISAFATRSFSRLLSSYTECSCRSARENLVISPCSSVACWSLALTSSCSMLCFIFDVRLSWLWMLSFSFSSLSRLR